MKSTRSWDREIETLEEDGSRAEPELRRSTIVPRATSYGSGPRLLGREGLIEQILTAITALGARVVTLFGPPGIGKSALAMEIARRLSDHTSSSAWCAARLADATPEMLTATILEAIGDKAREASEGEAALQGRALPDVVVLDACDDVLDAVTDLIRRVEANAKTSPTFILTTREVLGIAEEHVFEVPALELPRGASADGPAAELLLTRAEQARRGASSVEDPNVIADIVRSLEGIPLAIELAASRASVLTLEELRERLAEQDLDAGTFGAQARPEHPRHRTMRAAIESAFHRLSAGERAALAQLSVFRGGFDLRAAEAVVDLAGYGSPAITDVLHALRSKSFLKTGREALVGAGPLQPPRTPSDLTHNIPQPKTPPRRARFEVYESIRRIAAEALEDTEVSSRHASWFLRELAEAGRSRGERLRGDLDNYLAVHRRALAGQTEGGQADAVRIVLGLSSLSRTMMPTHLTLQLIEETLNTVDASSSVSFELRGELLLMRSRILEVAGRKADARAAAECALLLPRGEDANDRAARRLEAAALARLGSVGVNGGELDRGIHHLRCAIDLDVLDPEQAADAWRALGTGLRAQGDTIGARAAHEQSLLLRDQVGDEHGAIVERTCLAALHFQTGDLEPARLLASESRERAGALSDRFAWGYATGVLGSVLCEMGRLDEAVECFEQSLACLDLVGDRRLAAIFLGYGAAARQLLGQRMASARAYESAIAILREQNDAYYEGYFASLAAGCAFVTGLAADGQRYAETALRGLMRSSSPEHTEHGRVLTLILRGQEELGLMRVSLEHGDDRSAKVHRDAARSILADTQKRASSHDDLRLAYRLLEHATLGRVDVGRVSGKIITLAPSSSALEDAHTLGESDMIPATKDSTRPPPVAHPTATLEVGPDARWFRVDGGPRVNLQRRRALRLVLRALVERRVEAAGQPIPKTELVDVGWPGEKMLLRAAMNRLYVTIRSLRELGLRSLLVRQDEGYLLDPESELSYVPSGDKRAS